MAADFLWVNVVVFCCVFPVWVAGQANNTVNLGSSSSGCTCDLTVNACDVNCCCDPDCTVADSAAFTECKDFDANRDDRVCVSKDVIFRQNTEFTTENTGTGLFCIVRDNYASRNFYNDVQTAATSEEFSSLRSQAMSEIYEYSTNQEESIATSSIYQVGDPVVLVFDNGVRGFLALPKPLLGSECDDYNAAGYRQDSSTECTRTITDLASQCETLEVLAARSYYFGFQVARNPLSVSSNSTTNSKNSSSASNETISSTRPLLGVVVTEPILCNTALGVPSVCPFTDPPDPSYDAGNKTCNNVVLEVTYTIQYSNTSTDIVSAAVQLLLGSISADEGLDLQQKVSINFLKEGSEQVFQRSGNPGYLVGQSVVAGRLTTLGNKEAILLSSDRNTWLSVIGLSPSGACDNSSERSSVAFGIDMRIGCTISIPQTVTTPQCQLIQETLLNTLLGDLPSHVASFGNSDVNRVGDWVKILNSRPTNEAEEGGGGCLNMRLGVEIEILFANFGFLANPQPKIVGVMVKYDDPKDVRYQCTGIQCQPGLSSLEQQVEVVTSVVFVDVSDKPDAQIKPKPTFEAKASSDFFYPFL